MNTVKNELARYFNKEKKTLGYVTFITVLFWVVNLLGSIRLQGTDELLGLLLGLFFVLVIPPIVSFITFSKTGEAETIDSNKVFYTRIIVYTVIPVLLLGIFTAVMDLIMPLVTYWETLSLLQPISLAASLMTIVFVLDFKILHLVQFKYILKYVLIASFYVAISYFTSYVETQTETSGWFLLSSIIYFFLVPIGLLEFYCKKKILHIKSAE